MPHDFTHYQRVVSLTAALTETLFAIGAGDRVVGVTDTCDYPDKVRTISNVSCWFEPDMEKLSALKPDLVLGMKTTHDKVKAALKKEGIATILVSPATVAESLDTITMLGDHLRVGSRAKACVDQLRLRMAQLESKVDQIPIHQRIRVSRVLDIDDDQLIVAGPLSFQFDVISRAGGINITGETGEAYPKVSFDQFYRWDPEMVFFCGYDLNFISRLYHDKKWKTLQAVRSHNVHQFDCALTCRTGPRIVDMAELLFDTLYGQEHTLVVTPDHK